MVPAEPEDVGHWYFEPGMNEQGAGVARELLGHERQRRAVIGTTSAGMPLTSRAISAASASKAWRISSTYWCLS